MRNPSPKSDAILALLRATPEGILSGATMADALGDQKVHNTSRVVCNLMAAGKVLWVREPGPHAPHRTRLFAPEHAPRNAQMGPPGVKGITMVPKAGATHKAARLEPAAPVQGPLPKPKACPSGTDHRYTVRALPDGYRSALNPNECRPWANVAAQARAA